jgi:hypothetical protein
MLMLINIYYSNLNKTCLLVNEIKNANVSILHTGKMWNIYQTWSDIGKMALICYQSASIWLICKMAAYWQQIGRRLVSFYQYHTKILVPFCCRIISILPASSYASWWVRDICQSWSGMFLAMYCIKKFLDIMLGTVNSIDSLSYVSI